MRAGCGAVGERGGDEDRGEAGDRPDREVELVTDQWHQGGEGDDRDHRVAAISVRMLAVEVKVSLVSGQTRKKIAAAISRPRNA